MRKNERAKAWRTMDFRAEGSGLTGSLQQPCIRLQRLHILLFLYEYYFSSTGCPRIFFPKFIWFHSFSIFHFLKSNLPFLLPKWKTSLWMKKHVSDFFKICHSFFRKNIFFKKPQFSFCFQGPMANNLPHIVPNHLKSTWNLSLVCPKTEAQITCSLYAVFTTAHKPHINCRQSTVKVQQNYI